MFGRNKLSGVYTAIVTPFDAKQNVDFRWIEKHLIFQHKAGIDGVVVCGTNGEGQSLSAQERREIVEYVCKRRRSLRIIVGAGFPSLSETIEFVNFCRRFPIEALLLVPPYFDRNATEEGVANYFSAVASCSRLPILLYNIPKFTGVPITAGLLRRLGKQKRIIGVKDSSGDVENTRTLLKEFRSLRIFSGSDVRILDSLKAGVHGIISGIGNVFPAEVRAVYDAFRERGAADDAQNLITALSSVLYAYPARAATKYALEVAGMPATHVRPPEIELTEQQKLELCEKLGRV